MHSSTPDPVLPIVIVPLAGGKAQEPRCEELPDLRHWQIEEFLRQTGKADNTQRTYRGQLQRFAIGAIDRGWMSHPATSASCQTTMQVTGNVSTLAG